jgi:hypothetical protein
MSESSIWCRKGLQKPQKPQQDKEKKFSEYYSLPLVPNRSSVVANAASMPMKDKWKRKKRGTLYSTSTSTLGWRTHTWYCTTVPSIYIHSVKMVWLIGYGGVTRSNVEVLEPAGLHAGRRKDSFGRDNIKKVYCSTVVGSHRKCP